MVGPFAQPPVTRPSLGERLTYAVASGPGSVRSAHAAAEKPRCGKLGRSRPRFASLRRADEPAELVAVFESDVVAAYWPRRIDADIGSYLAEACRGSLRAGARWMLRTDARLDFAGLPEGQGRQAVHAELAFLCELYSDLTGCRELGVRIEVLERAMCPCFHTDRVGLRLLCTYRGGGTECLLTESAEATALHVDRSHRPAAGYPQTADTRIVRLPSEAVVLLKGDAWPGNEGRGAVHRSPGLKDPGRFRILLAIDGLG